MKITTLHFRLILAISITAMVASSAIAAPFKVRKGSTPFVPGEVLVKFKPSVSAQTQASALSAMGGAAKAKLRRDLVQVKLPTSQSVEATVASLKSDPNVEYAQPNYIYHALATPNDASYGEQWAFNNAAQIVATPSYNTHNPGSAGLDMNMQLAWDHISDCSSVVVAVLDTGVNYNQQDLSPNMWNGVAKHGDNFATVGGVVEGAVGDPMDLNGHGTHVAGIIGARGNDATGITGVCWTASIMAVRVLNSTGAGSTSSIISGIQYAVDNGAKVINMSLGGGGAFDQAYSNAISYAQTHDVVVVVAAGNDTLDNDASGNTSYPCNFTHSNLICVAALDQAYALADFTNWGATSVDVGAPGTNILSTWAGSSAALSDALDGNTLAATGLHLPWTVNGTGTAGFTLGATAPNTFPYSAGTYYNALTFAGSTTWPSAYAPANTDARIWTQLNLSSFDAATLDVFGAAHVVSDGGSGGFAMAYNAAGTDPFVGTPTYFPGAEFAANETTPATTPVFTDIPTFSLSGCNKSSTCSVGFQMKTGSTTTNLGMAVVGFTINVLNLNNTSYIAENGTSMASPAVAGLATMLRAYNPQYTADDVVANIKNSGRNVASLNGKTTTGKAVDAMKALSHINQPTGLSVTVQ